MFQVKVNQPNLPKGAAVVVTGLPSLKNGETATITEEEARLFEALQGQRLDKANIYGVTVSAAKEGGK